jgi:Aspartyl protease
MSRPPPAPARFALLLPLLALAACAGSDKTVCRSEIALQDQQNLILTDVLVNGTPVPGILDTGAQTSAVTDGLVSRLGLLGDPRHGTLMSGIGSEGTARGDALVSQFELAGYDPGTGHYPVISVPLDTGKGAPLGALIGADLLSHFDIDFDIAHNRAVLYDPDRCQGPLPDWPGPAVALPFEVIGSGRLLLKVKVDGHDLDALLDSGATASVIDLPAAERLGVTAEDLAREPGGSGFGAAGVGFQRVLHRFHSMEIAGERFDAPNISVLDRPLREADMLLGLDWLRTHRVWVSYHRHTLFIARPVA